MAMVAMGVLGRTTTMNRDVLVQSDRAGSDDVSADPEVMAFSQRTVKMTGDLEDMVDMGAFLLLRKSW